MSNVFFLLSAIPGLTDSDTSEVTKLVGFGFG